MTTCDKYAKAWFHDQSKRYTENSRLVPIGIDNVGVGFNIRMPGDLLYPKDRRQINTLTLKCRDLHIKLLNSGDFSKSLSIISSRIVKTLLA